MTFENVSRASVYHAEKVRKNGVPDLFDAVQQGRASVSAAAVVAQLPKRQQRRIVAEGGDAIAEHAAELRRQQQQQRQASAGAALRWNKAIETALSSLGAFTDEELRDISDSLEQSEREAASEHARDLIAMLVRFVEVMEGQR